MLGLGPTELIILLVVALVVIGPGKLPELGGAIGRGIKDFKKSMGGEEEQAPAPQKAE